MTRSRTHIAIAVASMLTLLAAVPAHSAQRTFVATYGVDNPACSLAAPCRQFSAAVGATDQQGEVVALDSGGYGPVTITKSVSIIAPPGIYAGISVPSGGTGVLIATVGVKVVLRGLTINSLAGGFYGVRITAGAELFIENCVISNFLSVAGGNGINIQAPAKVTISGSVIRDNFSGVSAGSGSTVTIVNSQVLNNSGRGIGLSGGSPGDTTEIIVSDTLVSGSNACIGNFAQGGTYGHISATRVTATGCTYGIRNDPADANSTMWVGYSMVTRSSYPFFTNDFGLFFSMGNNLLTVNSTVTGPIIEIGGQ